MDFPTDVAEFENDPRISFSKEDNSWLLETAGREFLFNTILKRWVETIDEDLIRQQQEGYKFAGVTETEATHPRDRKKRKKAEDENDETKAKKPRVNTAVWVTSIPLDAELEEIRETFARYGMLAEELDTGKPRIKMYCDDEGKFKGEALVVYFRPESVHLAIQMLDDTDFRLGVPDPAGKMRVQEADFSYKREQTAPTKLSRQDKKKIQDLKEKMQKKLADWSDDESAPAVKKTVESDKFVVLKHMFTLQELKDDPAALLDITEDIHDEASKIGDVTKVGLYDEEADGVVMVRFLDPAAAVKCVKAMNGRRFSGNAVVAYIWDGQEKFKKSNPKRAAALDSDENDESEAERLERFGAWLEGDEKQGNGKSHENGKNENGKNESGKNEENGKSEAK